MPDTILEIDLRIYPLLAVQKTCATLSPRCDTYITQGSDNQLTVTLRPRADSTPDDLAATFNATLLDLTLQTEIAERTKDIRLALVRAAFAEALGPFK
jgi:His-Xaa-Ser system protein HxsD